MVLLHGGEFGANARIGWERTIGALAERHRVLAPDMLGFGGSAKVVDFTDGRGMRIRHIARFCEVIGVESAHFVGNSMGAINLLVDATSEAPVLPVRSLATICGGGEIQRNEHVGALYDYDATVDGMRRIVEALFADPVLSRPTTSTCGGATSPASRPERGSRWRQPGSAGPAWTPPSTPSSARAYDRITVPTLVVEGGGDKLLPPGWAAEIAGQIADGRSAVIDDAGHCPQIEQPEAVNALLLDFFEGSRAMTELAGKVAIVTGGASGLGAGLVRAVRRRRRQGRDRRRRHRRLGEALAAELGADADVHRRPTSSDIEPGRPAGDDGGRRRSAVCTSWSTTPGSRAPMHRTVPRRRPRRLPPGHGGQPARRDGRHPRRRPAHGRARRRLDHQPDVDRRHPGRRRRDDLPGVEGRRHPVHQVRGNRVGALRDPGRTPSRRATSAPRSSASRRRATRIASGSSSSRRGSASRCATTGR